MHRQFNNHSTSTFFFPPLLRLFDWETVSSPSASLSDSPLFWTLLFLNRLMIVARLPSGLVLGDTVMLDQTLGRLVPSGFVRTG